MKTSLHVINNDHFLQKRIFEFENYLLLELSLLWYHFKKCNNCTEYTVYLAMSKHPLGGCISEPQYSEVSGSEPDIRQS